MRRAGIAALVAVLAMAVPVAANPSRTDIAHATTTPSNVWQIVSGAYNAQHQNSKGLSQSEFASYGITQSDAGDVRVSKTLEPTDTEDEFIVHLSIDVLEKTVQESVYASYLESAVYEATTSNNNHGGTLGGVVSSMTGNQKVSVAGGSKYSNSAKFTVLDSSGNTLATDVSISWSQANNVTFFLKVSDNEYILMGVSVKSGAKNTVQLSDEAYKIVKREVESSISESDKPQLNKVVDVMGADIEYLGTAAVDAGLASYDGDSRTLAWEPAYNAHHETESTYQEVSTASGATVTKETWHYGAATCSYRVRLNTQAAGFESSYGISNGDLSEAAVYDTNESAQLSYESKISGKTETVAFAKPKVRGNLYDLSIDKVDQDGNPLSGATFKVVRQSDGAVFSMMSNDQGKAQLTSLSGGVYTITETKAPDGYRLPSEAESSRTLVLSQTLDADALTASSIESNHAMSSAVGDAVTFKNELVIANIGIAKKDDEGSALPGAVFSLYRDANGDGVLGADDVQISSGLTTDKEGRVSYVGATPGTYFFVEDEAPAGYVKLSDPVAVAVDADGVVDDANVSLVDGVYYASATDDAITLTVRKTVADGYPDAGSLLEGACFQLYSDISCEVPYGKAAQTGSDGSYTWGKLPAGTYYLKETRPPAGYQLDDTVYEVVVSSAYGATDGSYANLVAVKVANSTQQAKAPDIDNTITVADSPNPDMPVASGPGSAGFTFLGFALAFLGMAAISLRHARWRNQGD